MQQNTAFRQAQDHARQQLRIQQQRIWQHIIRRPQEQNQGDYQRALDSNVLSRNYILAVYDRIFACFQLAARTNPFAFGAWVQRLLAQDLLPYDPVYTTHFGLEPDRKDESDDNQTFAFTSRDFMQRIQRCGGVPPLGAMRFDAFQNQFRDTISSRIPIVSQLDLPNWIRSVVMPEMDHSPVCHYHAPEAPSAPNSVELIHFNTAYRYGDDFRLLAAAGMYTLPQLRHWAAMLFYSDPRIVCRLRRWWSSHPDTPLLKAVVFLVQCLLFYIPCARDVWPREANRALDVIVNQILAPEHHVVDAPTDIMTYLKPHNIPDKKDVNLAAEKIHFNDDNRNLENDFHFQQIFDRAFPHYHNELRQRQEVANQRVQIYLVRSPDAWKDFVKLYPDPVPPYTYIWNVYDDGGIDSSRTFTQKTWFILLGVVDPQRRELEYEEDCMGPAPLGKDKLRVTRCSFFRRYIPDNIDVEFRGSAAPFTLVPTASVFSW
jgi:hypothetical protein